MAHTRTGLSLSTALALSLITAGVAQAQQGPGLTGTLSFSESLRFSDNPDFVTNPTGSGTTSLTSLGFRLNSQTRTETFDLNLGTGARGEFYNSATKKFTLQNKSARLFYSREGADSRLSTALSYSAYQLKDQTFGFYVDGQFDPDALVLSGGTRQRTDLSARLETGTNSPFGVSATLRMGKTRYLNASDPTLVDNRNASLDAAAKFVIDPALTARATAGVRQSKESTTPGTTRTTSYFGGGLDGELKDGLSYSGSLTFDRSETKVGGTSTSNKSGVGVSLSVSQELASATYGAKVSSRIDSSGRRTQLSVNRSAPLPLGSIDLSLGVVDQNSTTKLTTRMQYTYDTPDGGFTANVVQSPSTDLGTALLNTSVALGYRQNINELSSWDAGVSYGSSANIGGTTRNKKLSARMAYHRDLTQDWGLTAGVEHQRVEGQTTTTESNTLFLSVGRDFTFGF